MNDEENMTPEEKIRALTIAGRRQATVGEVQAAVKPLKSGLRLNGILTSGGILGVGAFLLWSMTTLVGVQSAQAQTAAKADAGEARIVALEKNASETNVRLIAVERSTIRSEAMNEQIVIRLGMVPPPKTAPDGGK